jgi:hypothetical protein
LTHQAADFVGGTRPVSGILVHKPSLGLIAEPRLAALHVRVDVNAADPGHAAGLRSWRADIGHVDVENIITQDAAVERLVARRTG